MNKLFHFLSTPYGLFFHIFFLGATTIAILYEPLKTFSHSDPAPELLPKSAPAVQKAINSHTPAIVEVGFSLSNFAEFDITTNNFIAEGVVWFLFDPEVITLENLQEFSFDKGSMLEKSDPMIKKIGSKTLARFDVRFSFTTNLDYRNFPLDDHRIYMVLKNEHLLAEQVEFIAAKENFTHAPDVEESGWELISSDVRAGYIVTELSGINGHEELVFPRVQFSLDYDRSGIHLLIILFTPLLLLFFTALAVFLVRVPSNFDASNTFMGSLFALISYLFVLETIAPKVGYLMLSDLIYFGTLLCTFTIATLSWWGSNLKHSYRGFIGTTIEFLLLTYLWCVFFLWR